VTVEQENAVAHTTVVRRRIESVINQVLEDTGRSTRRLTDDDTLSDSIGLDSLDVATTVVRLEQEFGVDPFRNVGFSARSFGQFVAAYERALGGR
jgi:acyl carrier protein